MISLTVLGTSSMVPTKERAHSCVLLQYQADGILFDCGEGAQRQMNIAGINRNCVRIICLSHWHADHVAGLPSLLQTINNRDAPRQIIIIGPKETRERTQKMLDATIFDDHLDLHFIEVDSAQPIRCYETEEYELWSVNLHHSTPVVGFSFVQKDTLRIDKTKQQSLGVPDGPVLAQLQKGNSVEFAGKTITPEEITYIKHGKKVTYVTDTVFCQEAVDLAQHSDLLISESTYAASEEDKAEEYLHMTATQAAQIASLSKSKALVLTHFSQRYTTVDQLGKEAQSIFPETKTAFDFMKLKI